MDDSWQGVREVVASTSKRQGNLLALSGGVFFAAFFIASLVLGDVLASAPLPLPDADFARFYEGSRVAALASSSL